MSIRRKVFSAFLKAMPIRVGAMHICIPDADNDELKHNYTNKSPATSANVIKSMIALSIGAKNRSKSRIHTGTTRLSSCPPRRPTRQRQTTAVGVIPYVMFS